MVFVPDPSKSFSFLVTRYRSCVNARAAISDSIAGIVRPYAVNSPHLNITSVRVELRAKMNRISYSLAELAFSLFAANYESPPRAKSPDCLVISSCLLLVKMKLDLSRCCSMLHNVNIV